ncbi:MAG: S8 family peptidase [Anaerolineae bacterium]|nr:S8 family peptidase [Anaerolineae bacterium]MCB9103493.1 S8 family peptidase [Anaerolineales bacterium]
MAGQLPPSETRPFLAFTQGPKNKLRQRVRGGGPKPRENTEAHGQNLLKQIDDFQRLIDSQARDRASDLPPLPDDTQVIIESKRLTPEQVGSLGLKPIEERDNGLLVTISPNVTLPTLATKAQSYVSQRTDSGNPKFNGVIAPIEQIRPAGRHDKAGDRLAAWIEAGHLQPNQPVWVDIELAGGQSSDGVDNRHEFYTYLTNFSDDLSPYQEDVVTATGHYLIEVDYSLHRVLLPGRAVLDLLDDSRANWILSIDLVPEVESYATPLAATAQADLPPLPDLSPDSPRVVVIDSGIAAEHPLFTTSEGRTIMGRQRNFLPDTVEPADLTTDEIDQGHGTAIASVVAYGSLLNLTQAPDEITTPVVWIENAKILLPAAKLDPDAVDSSPQLHPLQFPKALIREVVEVFHQPLPQRCKIFNLSIGTVPHPQQAISNWAEEIDNCSARSDLLFVISAGDLTSAELVELMTGGATYPAYLLSPKTRLRDPGQAYNALTVGALTPIPPTLPWPSAPFLAQPEHPAPFTRSGLLQFGPVKPDVVETGGNWQKDDLTALPESAILVANRNYVTGQADQPLGFQTGVGLAAAQVTHLAGRIQARYPNATANLIRALIVNSAAWPAEFIHSLTGPTEAALGDALTKEDRHTLLRLCGYGRPRPEQALSSNAHCLVFIAEDEFSWTVEDKNSSGRYPAKVSFFAIRFEPDDLFNLPPATRLRVSVTLTYNPAVRKTQRRRYQAVDMRWELRRREEPSDDFRARWMAEAETDDDEEDRAEDALPLRPWPWQLKPVLNPGSRARRGSLIRDWFDVYAHDLPHTLELVALAQVAPWRKPPEPLMQRYALVVSIETLGAGVAIYDTVRVIEENTER